MTSKSLKSVRDPASYNLFLCGIVRQALQSAKRRGCESPSVANSAVFPRNLACFRPVPREKKLRVAVFGLLFLGASSKTGAFYVM